MSREIHRVARLAAWTLALAAGALAPRTSAAFGGVFPQESDARTQVSGHRMAIAFPRDATVMWDQVTWSASDARPLAWVLPIRPGSTVELTGNAWFESLEASTEPIVYSPPKFGASAGCSLAGCAATRPLGSGPDRLQVQQRLVARVTESIVIAGADPAALPRWLRERSFEIPQASATAIADYAREGWDFAVFRLDPDCNAQTSPTARVITRGRSDALLPTRLLPTGAALAVSIQLFTLGETRFAPTGFVSTTVDIDKLSWNESKKQSNYEELAKAALREGGGRTFVTELADAPFRAAQSTRSTLPAFYELYPGLCGKATIPDGADVATAPPLRSCTPTVQDSGHDAADASEIGDASDDADGAADASAADAAEDAGREAGIADGGPTSVGRDTCAVPDDLAAGLAGIDTDNVTLTRMRGQLSTSALGQSDLKLTPASGFVSNQLQAIAFEGERNNEPSRSQACGTVRPRVAASWTGALVSLLAVALAWARRRAR